jgi:hypothetical protein
VFLIILLSLLLHSNSLFIVFMMTEAALFGQPHFYS